jgi:hypothetical protein
VERGARDFGIPDEPIGVKIDFECSLYLELLTGMCAAGIGNEMLEIAPLEESLDKFTRLSGLSSFTKWSRGRGIGH